MLIHKAAAWALVLNNLAIPVTFQSRYSLGIMPKISTAIAQTIPAETKQTATEVLQKDEDPPSTSPGFYLADIKPSVKTPVIGKSRATEIEENRINAENKRKAAEEAEIKAEKEAERIKHLAAQKKLLETHPEQKQAEYVKVIGTSPEQCVLYAKRITGNKKIQGYAGHIKVEGLEPKIGAGALEKNYGHVSVVIAIEGDYLILHDANYVKGAITERRVLKSTQRGYVY